MVYFGVSAESQRSRRITVLLFRKLSAKNILPCYLKRKRSPPNTFSCIGVLTKALSYVSCLNDAILSGPALQPPLPSVVIQFREGAIAWASDREAMFSRFRLNLSDANYFSFLWQVSPPKTAVCQMYRLPFGATCSPFIAIQTTRRAVADAGVGEKAVEAVQKRMYVDDYVLSAKSADQGVAEASTVRKALGGADLHFQDWISNSVEFVAAIQEEKKPIPEITSLSVDSESMKVLGEVWNTTSDALGFRINRPADEEYTRLSLTCHVAG